MLRILNFFNFISLSIILILISSCSKDENIISTTEINYEQKYNISLFSRDTINGYEIKLYTKSELKSGFNKIYYSVSKNGTESIKNANFNLEMKMMMHSHSCPIDSSFTEENGLMSNCFVIVMPGNDDEKWFLTLDITLNDNTKLKLEKTLDIRKMGQIKMFVFEGKTYFVSEADFSKYNVGKNDLNFKINSKIDNFTWANENDLSIEIKPWMASMGHGSPNNEKPLSIGKGYYKGKVNFTMTGDWEINYTIKKSDVIIYEGKFDYILY